MYLLAAVLTNASKLTLESYAYFLSIFPYNFGFLLVKLLFEMRGMFFWNKLLFLRSLNRSPMQFL